jgi:RimJ/RimL family protein N-acetyltransferase
MPPFIGSGRVFLRPFEPEDAEVHHRWSADPDVIRFASLGPPLSLARARQRVARYVEEHGKDGHAFVICLAEDDRPIGEASLFHLDHLNGTAELGIFIGEQEQWGKGYGTDAVNALVDFGFGWLRLDRIWLEVWTENPRAIRSYEKAGFVREATLRHDRFEDGAFTDGHIMGILRDEWLARRSR